MIGSFSRSAALRGVVACSFAAGALAQVQHEAYLKPWNTPASRKFGAAVALSADTLVVGAPWERADAAGVNGTSSGAELPGSGAAYVFVRVGGTWVQEAYLKASNSGAWDAFGSSVAIDGDTVVVGAPGEDSAAAGVGGAQDDDGATDAGAAYVFERSPGGWSQTAYLKPSNTDAADEFGTAVAVSGDLVVVGAPYEDSAAVGVDGDASDDSLANAGAAYVFERDGGTWSQSAYLKSAAPDPNDAFGATVAVSGVMVVVGVPNEDGKSLVVNGDPQNNQMLQRGAAFVFRRLGSGWAQEAYLKSSSAGFNNFFGSALAAHGDRVVVGARGEKSVSIGVDSQSAGWSEYAGAAFVFVRQGSEWSIEGYLKASNTQRYDGFGGSVAMSDDLVLVAAPGEDGAVPGANGDGQTNGATNSGAAYVYSRHGDQWSFAGYVKALDVDPYDEFGMGVAVSGSTLALGCPGDDSLATGVGGDPADDSGDDNGGLFVLRAVDLAGVYCSGEGGGTPCPCGNAGGPSTGCDNSFGTGGAKLTFRGAPTMGNDSSFLRCVDLPEGVPALLFQGTAVTADGQGVPFGDGLRCVSGSIRRLATRAAVGGRVRLPEPGEEPLHRWCGIARDGGRRSYQVWYRNVAPFCTAAGFNLSNGLLVDWMP